MTVRHSIPRSIIILGTLLVLIATLACTSFTEELSSIFPEAQDCKSATEPTQRDVDYILAFTGDIFKSKEWQRSYADESMRASVTWMHANNGSLAHLSYLIFSCGYTQKDIDDYFSPQNFQEILFSGYQNLNRTGICTQADSNLTLYEFAADYQGEKYLIRDWVKLDTPTRVLDFMLIFPQTEQAQLDAYARQVFPNLSTCAE